MRYALLTIQSLNNPFTYIEAENTFQLDIRINTDLSRGSSSVFRAESLSAGDRLLGFVTAPIQEIRYAFKVTEINGTVITLSKELESKYGVSSERIHDLNHPLYMSVIQGNPNEVGKLFEVEESFFNRVETEMVEPFLTVDQVRENGQVYESPTEDPKEHHLAHNRIIFGSPGTGKSFELEGERKAYFGSNYERVTFHPNYSYGQFVGTYKPKPISGTNDITYELVPGPLLRLLAKALKFENRNYVLVVEEINRANTAAVFGDIFQLLDRNDDGESEYKIMVSEEVKTYLNEKAHYTLENNELFLPDNFYIWATMNTADQGVTPMDSAFKRRFDFEYIGIDDNQDEIEGITVTIPTFGAIDWNTFRVKLNEFLLSNVRNMKEDKLIGPFFIKEAILKDEHRFKEAFKNKLLMYLSEDVLKTNKSVLFNKTAPSFSKILEIYKKESADESIFSEGFLNFLQINTNQE
ncbi:AAA family ATPase [Gracilibacillus saliphilus]|uniref:AAA family ATPase n=1 Tax=Gracilibacillus saliphilus TaxID=543890 RepID=UPI0013D8DBCE|nr:AAA family ATPase [Gracilibacillus saliphilus]